MMQASIRIKLLTGLAGSDLLRLGPGKHFTDEGIQVMRHKTEGSSGKSAIYEWNNELRQAVPTDAAQDRLR